MILSQGFEIGKNGKLIQSSNKAVKITIPSDLIPKCPHCGEPMSMNLRADNTFVQNKGCYQAAEMYELFE